MSVISGMMQSRSTRTVCNVRIRHTLQKLRYAVVHAIGCRHVQWRLPVAVSGVYISLITQQKTYRFLRNEDVRLELLLSNGKLKRLTSEPVQQARCNGVYHLLSFAFTLAPWLSNRATMGASPLNAAACRGLRLTTSKTISTLV